MDQNTTEQTTPSEVPANLSIQDLLLVVHTLQVVSQRGAFRAEEMSNIGGLYDRLVSFLTASGAIKAAEPAEPQTGE
jgi:hypothetical protein